MVPVVVGVLVTLAVLWLVLLVALVVASAVLRPRGTSLRDAAVVVPDTVRMLRSLRRDPGLPAGARRWLAALVVYLAVPIDLVPDVIPVLGYADDVIVVALVLRRVVRAAGPAALEAHWTGSPAGLALVRRLAGVAGA